MKIPSIKVPWRRLLPADSGFKFSSIIRFFSGGRNGTDHLRDTIEELIELEEDGDGPTLVFGDGYDQTHEANQDKKENHENESDIPAYLRKQNQ